MPFLDIRCSSRRLVPDRVFDAGSLGSVLAAANCRDIFAIGLWSWCFAAQCRQCELHVESVRVGQDVGLLVALEPKQRQVVATATNQNAYLKTMLCMKEEEAVEHNLFEISLDWNEN